MAVDVCRIPRSFTIKAPSREQLPKIIDEISQWKQLAKRIYDNVVVSSCESVLRIQVIQSEVVYIVSDLEIAYRGGSYVFQDEIMMYFDDEENVLGVMTIVEDRSDRMIFIGDILVHPDYESCHIKGAIKPRIGTALVEYAKGLCEQHSIERLEAHPLEVSRGFFKKMGFRSDPKDPTLYTLKV